MIAISSTLAAASEQKCAARVSLLLNESVLFRCYHSTILLILRIADYSKPVPLAVGSLDSSPELLRLLSPLSDKFKQVSLEKSLRAYMHFRGYAFLTRLLSDVDPSVVLRARAGVLSAPLLTTHFYKPLAADLTNYIAERGGSCLYDIVPGLSNEWRRALFESLDVVFLDGDNAETLGRVYTHSHSLIPSLSFGLDDDLLLIVSRASGLANGGERDVQQLIVPKFHCSMYLKPRFDKIWFDVENKAMLVQDLQNNNLLIWYAKSTEPTIIPYTVFIEKYHFIPPDSLSKDFPDGKVPDWWYSDRHLLKDRSGEYFYFPQSDLGVFQPVWKEVKLERNGVSALTEIVDADLVSIFELYNSPTLKDLRDSEMQRLNVMEKLDIRQKTLLQFLQEKKPFKAIRLLRKLRKLSRHLRFTLPSDDDGGELIRRPIDYLMYH